MKHTFFFILGLLLATFGATGQTDVTDQYLTNAGFDVGWATSDVGNGVLSSVDGWSGTSTGDSWYYGGAIGYASGIKVNGTTIGAGPDGTSSGGALALSAGWDCTLAYTQALTLPSGLYRISYKAYNANTEASQAHNLIGFVEDNGTSHYGRITSFAASTWVEDFILLYLANTTSGHMSVGMGAVSGGSGSNAKLFVDYIRIERLEPDDSADLTDLVSNEADGWTNPNNAQNDGAVTAGGVTMAERWFSSLPTGEIMSQDVALPNGLYEAQVYCHGHVAWVDSPAASGATGYTTLSANGVEADIPVILNRGWEADEPKLYTLSNIPVLEENLTFSLTANQAGANWFTINVKQLTRIGPFPSQRYIVGDVNEDDDVTIADVTALVNIILGKQAAYRNELADVNEDGDVTIADVTALVNIILGKQAARVVDNNHLYARLSAMVCAEQSATENAEGANNLLTSATSLITGEDVSGRYDLAHYLTTLRITTSLSNVVSVSVYANGKEHIAGPMTISRWNTETSCTYQSGEALTYANSQESDVVTVTGNNAGTYVAFLRPVTLSDGVTVTVRTSDGKYYSQKFSGIGVGQSNNLAFTQTSATNLWMSTIPGNTYFSLLSTPGAHDACTSSVTSYTNIAKCQSEDLAGLLANGVRAFDLRPRYTSNTKSDIELDNLTIYHGYVSTGVKFKDAIDILINFVKDNPTEAVSVIMNKESTKLMTEPTDQSETWRASIRECFSDASRSPYLMGSVRGFHTLDDVRGKVSVVSRNPYGNSANGYRDVIYGAVIENWPDDGVVTNYTCDMTQAWSWVDCRASVEDAYNSSTSTKQTQVQTQLELANNNTDHYHFNYTYTSIASKPATYAQTMNPATVSIINKLTGPTGYVYADFMGSSSYGGNTLLKAVIDQNYKYVFKGRTRIQ